MTASHSNLDYFRGGIERSGSVPPTGLFVPFGGGCGCSSKTLYLGTEFFFNSVEFLGIAVWKTIHWLFEIKLRDCMCDDQL